MKTKFVFIVVLLFALGTISIANAKEPDTEIDKSIQFYLSIPESLPFFGMILIEDGGLYLPFKFELQYAITDYIAISVKPYFIADKFEKDESVYTYGLDPGIRIFPIGMSLYGPYVGISFLLGIVHRDKDNENTGKYFKTGLIIEGGYQWILASGLTFSAGAYIGGSTHIPLGNSSSYRPFTMSEIMINGFLWFFSAARWDIREFTINEINAKISIGYSF
jgi:hypothetical protein